MESETMVRYLNESFLSKYVDRKAPFGGNGLGHFVYLRTYSRWIDSKQRRETWQETVERVVNYSLNLHPRKDSIPYTELQHEAEEMFDAMFNLRVFTAGRALWVGGTPVTEKHGLASFNCAFEVIDEYEAFAELFLLLMLGCGVGFRVLPKDVEKLPPLRTHVTLYHQPYIPFSAEVRDEHTTTLRGKDGHVFIDVGDSKEGWVDSLRSYLMAMQDENTQRITLAYNSVRPKGEPLKTFGGRASGPEALREMFATIHSIITAENFFPWVKLRPIHCMDIANAIGYNVVCGGVRRTSEICLFAPDDEEILNAKTDLWVEGSSNYGKVWRGMSNNSIFFEEKPTKEYLAMVFDRIRNSAEPGFVNAEAARKRRPRFEGVNPLNLAA